VNSGRLVKADRVLAGLGELGSERHFAGKPPREAHQEVRKQIDRLTNAADTPLPASARPAARLERATVLLALDRLNEAAELLRPFAPVSPVAALLLATVYRDQERWADGDAEYTSALDRLLPRAASGRRARADCRLAFEGLAFNTRADRRPADAERALRRGLSELPDAAADFHYLLGTHYHDGGRPALALEHLRAAAELDPDRYRGPADELAREIRTTTRACLPWASP
jgi:tetratricopeptide (TPR) repeat protein